MSAPLNKVPTLALRGYPLMHNMAGRCAANDGYPWWCAFGYAAASSGTADARVVLETAQMWLQGWIYSASKANGPESIPEVVKMIIENQL
jgi:hypothetical protein